MRRLTVQDGSGCVIEKLPVGQLMHQDVVAPTAGAQGFAPGCIWLNLAGAAGRMLYLNAGTNASAVWVPLDGLTQAGRVVTLTATTTITAALHAERTMLLSLLGGFATTLPAATGSGAIYNFRTGIVLTSGTYVISTAPSTDVFSGLIFAGISGAATGKTWVPGGTDNTITMNNSTQGGAEIGDLIQLQDIQAGVWGVLGDTVASGSIATPFSHV